MSHPIGDTLDKLGVTLSRDDSDLITDALVICKVMNEDGDVRLAVAWSTGMSWIERAGMTAIAHETELREGQGHTNEGDY